MRATELESIDSQLPLRLISTGFPLYFVTKPGRPRLSLLAMTAMHCQTHRARAVANEIGYNATESAYSRNC